MQRSQAHADASAMSANEQGERYIAEHFTACNHGEGHDQTSANYPHTRLGACDSA